MTLPVVIHLKYLLAMKETVSQKRITVETKREIIANELNQLRFCKIIPNFKST